MNNTKIKQSFENLGKALARLEEALQVSHPNPLIIDGTIQRFEFVIELFWKVLKRTLEQEGILVDTPREALKQAYQINWLDNETAWLQMLKDRNETSHVYNQETANRIYQHIKQHYAELNNTYKKLLQRFNIENGQSQ